MWPALGCTLMVEGRDLSILSAPTSSPTLHQRPEPSSPIISSLGEVITDTLCKCPGDVHQTPGELKAARSRLMYQVHGLITEALGSKGCFDSFCVEGKAEAWRPSEAQPDLHRAGGGARIWAGSLLYTLNPRATLPGLCSYCPRSCRQIC